MKNSLKFIAFLFFLCLVSVTAYPQNAPASGFFKDVVADMEGVKAKILQLAEAMPEEKYSWRPADGVRSVSEVYNHIGGSNYYLLSFLGDKMPEGVSEDMEKSVTKKADIIEFIKKSYADAEKFISTLKEADLDKEVELPFGKFTERGVLFIVMTHGHEHLGQSIAYARTNGVVPPWSMPQK